MFITVIESVGRGSVARGPPEPTVDLMTAVGGTCYKRARLHVNLRTHKHNIHTRARGTRVYAKPAATVYIVTSLAGH